jgi:hypothetical protein
MNPARKLLCLAILFTLGLICCRIFEFDRPILNYCFGLLVAMLPFLALAIANYKKSVGLNPKSESGIESLKKLEGQ